MVRAAFRRFDHDHHFEPAGAGTRMTDTFDFASPLGPLGWLADALVLRRYMARLLRARCDEIRRAAESDDWKRFFP